MVDKIKRCISLLNSMAYSGDSHSPLSIQAVKEAHEALDQVAEDAQLGRYVRLMYSMPGADPSYLDKLIEWAKEQEGQDVTCNG